MSIRNSLKLFLFCLLMAPSVRAQSACALQSVVEPTTITYESRKTEGKLYGYSEFVSPSLPPKKFLQKTISGTVEDLAYKNAGCGEAPCSPGYPSDYIVSGTTSPAWPNQQQRNGVSLGATYVYSASFTPTHFDVAKWDWVYKVNSVSVVKTENHLGPITPVSIGAQVSWRGGNLTVGQTTMAFPCAAGQCCIRIYDAGWTTIIASYINLQAPSAPNCQGGSRDDWNLAGVYDPVAAHNNESYVPSIVDISQRYQVPIGCGTQNPISGGPFTLDPSESTYGGPEHFVMVSEEPVRREWQGMGCGGVDASGFYPSVGGSLVATLTDEYTEARAIELGLVQVSLGTDNIAYREQRGAGDFDFAFQEFTATAEFSTCPGDYLITYHYAKRVHGGTGAWEPYEEYEYKRFQTSTEKVERTVPAPAQGDLYEYTITKITAIKTSCDVATVVGSGFHNMASVHSMLTLGQIDSTRGAGVLLLDESAIDSSIYLPLALDYVGPDVPEVEVIRDTAGAVRQVKAPAALANVVALVSPLEGYDVEFYHANQVGEADPESGLYAFTGAPFVVHRFDNPDAGQVVLTQRLRVTETRDSAPKVFVYAYDATNETWSLSQGDGLLVTEEVETTDTNGDTVKTRTLKTQAGAVASVVATTLHAFPWGEELIQEVLDPAGAALTTVYEYYSTVPTNDPNYGRLKQRTSPAGSWERYTYDSTGRTLKTIRPWLDAAPTTIDEALCRVTETLYDTIADADSDTLPETRTTTIERLLGTETGRSYRIDWSAPVTLGADTCKRRSDIVCVASSADWNATLPTPPNLVTETLTYATGDFIGRTRRTLSPDGTASLITYTLASGTLTTTASSGEPNTAKDAIIDGRETVTLTSPQGQVIGETVTDIASALDLSSWTATQFDAVGRPTRFDYTDGTYIARLYACCGLESETDRIGLTTTYGYDDLGRLEATTRQGIITKTGYDAAGHVLTVTRIGTDDSEIVQESNLYDLAGRRTSTTDARNRTTTFDYSVDGLGQSVVTTTYPDAGTRIETSAKDGSTVSIAGAAAAPLTYIYGIDAAGPYTKETRLGSAAETTEWTQSYTDFAGRPYKTVYPDGTIQQSYYNTVGQLIRQVDPDGVTTLFGYNDRGEQTTTAVDLNANDEIDAAGLDRITKTTSTVTTKTEASVTYTVLRNTTEVWDTDNQDNPVTVVTSEQSADGLRSWQTASGLTTKSVTTLDGSGDRTVTTTTPDGALITQIYTGGHLESQVTSHPSLGTLSSIAYAYDEHGRLETATDLRNGATTYTYYDDDQVESVTTPDPDTTLSGSGYDAQETTYTYDDAGRVETITQPDATVINTTYWPTGAVKRTWGSRTYPTEYTYDAQGRLKTLTTWQDYAAVTGAAVTTWNYHTTRGWLLNKRYADNTGPSYTYKPSGRLLTRTDARAKVTTYGYDAAGGLETINYSDTTPDVALTYDRRGRLATTTDAAGLLTRSYHASGQLEDEAYTSGLLDGFTVDRGFDSLQRPGSLALLATGYSLPATSYSYDAASRLDTVTTGIDTATYGYVTNSPLVGTVTFKNASTTRLTTTKAYDKLNRLSSIGSQLSAGPALSYAYTYNAANQRTRVTREDSAYWSYGYDALGQVTSGKKFLSSSAAVPGHDYAWTFDDIGNRETATTNGQAATYTPNTLNQYDQRTVPGAIDVLGAAASTATVTVAVDGGAPQSTTRQGEVFYRQLATDNTATARNPALTIVGVQNFAGPNDEDAVTEIAQTAFVAKTPESYGYDLDGNLTSDGRWTYTWDAENRLIVMETRADVVGQTAGLARQKLEFTYDAQSRRIAKKVSTWNLTSGLWDLASETRFLYDGWNLLAEFDIPASGPWSLASSYSWGLDVSGSMQGAGGVGGLLSVTSHPSPVTRHFACHDGNGNVTGLVSASDGALTAEYDYTAFGETLLIEGPAAALNPFRFSTKYTDPETGLNYYGFRYYAPSTGRWLSRDPIEEEGGVNLYGMVGNDAVNQIDPKGLYGTGVPGLSAPDISSNGQDDLAITKSLVYRLGYNSGDLANRLLYHYMTAKGADYTLSVSEMRRVFVRASIKGASRRSGAKTLQQYIDDAKKGSGCCTEVKDLRVEGGALANGTLGGFTIIYDGKLCMENGGWVFTGSMSFFDYWNFEPHHGPTQRSARGESDVEYAREHIRGTSFSVYSVKVQAEQNSYQDETQWSGSYWWANYSDDNRHNRGDLR